MYSHSHITRTIRARCLGAGMRLSITWAPWIEKIEIRRSSFKPAWPAWPLEGVLLLLFWFLCFICYCVFVCIDVVFSISYFVRLLLSFLLFLFCYVSCLLCFIDYCVAWPLEGSFCCFSCAFCLLFFIVFCVSYCSVFSMNSYVFLILCCLLSFLLFLFVMLFNYCIV